MSDAQTGDHPTATPVQDARALLRAARAGTLATSAAGQPFASLITPATAPDGSILMLLSGLSEHTRHLRDEPRCAVMVAGPPAGLNPQTAPRLTVTGLAAHEPDPAMKARWVALHPYAAFYAGFADFQVFRLRPVGGQFIGGFASANPAAPGRPAVGPRRLLPPSPKPKPRSSAIATPITPMPWMPSPWRPAQTARAG